MSNNQAISHERHSSLRWKRSTNYTFAAADSIVPLVVSELPQALLSMPLALVKHDEDYLPVALLGLEPGINLFVAPDRRWIGQYTPAAYRFYPFRLINANNGQHVLCIDEDSGLVSDDPEGEPFFTEDGSPAPALTDIMTVLSQLEESRLGTVRACAALRKFDLLTPWVIGLKTRSGDKSITGLLQVDEAALNQLPSDALLELRQAGALAVAYCQLMSMQHLPLLGKMAEAYGKAAEQSRNLAANGKSNIDLFLSSGTISFAGLGKTQG